MREALGQTFLINIIIVFVVIFIILFAGSTSYTKAYKVKNRILSIIEEERGYNNDAKKRIDEFLSNTGYKVVQNGQAQDCKKHYETGTIKSKSTTYRYCVEEFTVNSGQENEQKFYGVTTFMYFELPVISSLLEIPVYGESKHVNALGNQ
jgi:Uncharacterized protein conserved in archaea